MLSRAADGQIVGVLHLGPEDGDSDLVQWKAWLRAGARQLGGGIRFQEDPGILRYEVRGMTA